MDKTMKILIILIIGILLIFIISYLLTKKIFLSRSNAQMWKNKIIQNKKVWTIVEKAHTHNKKCDTQNIRNNLKTIRDERDN